MNQVLGLNSVTLFSLLTPHFAEPEFDTSAVFEWHNEGDKGHALLVQRHENGEVLVLTFGTMSSGKLFVEYWVRPQGAMTCPLPEEKLEAIPVRTDMLPGKMTAAVNFMVEVVKMFYQSSPPSNVISLQSRRKKT